MLFETQQFIEGFQLHRNYLSQDRQVAILEACRRVIKVSPLWTPKFAGKGFVQEFALQNTNCGKFGWLGDENGFRYSANGTNGKPFQPIPDEIMSVVNELAPVNYKAENCLINFYQDRTVDGKLKKSRLGLHQDKTEKDLTAPIISISIGQAAVFQIGGLTKEEPVSEVEVYSGDVMVMAGLSRNAFHGIKHLLPGTCPTELGMKTEARINLTIRQVNPISAPIIIPDDTELRDIDKVKRNAFQDKHSPDEIILIERKFLDFRKRTRDEHPAKALTEMERMIYADYLESVKGNVSGAFSFRNYVEPKEKKKR